MIVLFKQIAKTGELTLLALLLFLTYSEIANIGWLFDILTLTLSQGFSSFLFIAATILFTPLITGGFIYCLYITYYNKSIIIENNDHEYE